jgi:hypothetical protein
MAAIALQIEHVPLIVLKQLILEPSSGAVVFVASKNQFE